MTPLKPFNEVEGLFSARKKIEKKIEKIQKKCKHSTKSIKQVQERLDSSTMVIRWVCDECAAAVGYPSEDELKKYLK